MIQIRRADLRADHQSLIEFFGRFLTDQSDARRFDWLYFSNPYGVARAWLACAKDDSIIGAAAAFPRKFYVDGEQTDAFVLGDFCLHPEHRSLGPALQLQRACLTDLQSTRCDFFYDFPSDRMMAIYKRMQITTDRSVVRWAKPLRVEGLVKRAVGSTSLARALSVPANTLLKWRGWRGDRGSCDLALVQGACTTEFAALDESLRELEGVRAIRTTEYLNWRFLAHPTKRHAILTAKRQGQLSGYVVFSRDVDDAAIVDLHCRQDASLVANLLGGAVDYLGRLGASTVSLSAIDSHPWSSIFERAGFRRREKAPLIVNTFPGSLLRPKVFQHWYLMRAERDS